MGPLILVEVLVTGMDGQGFDFEQFFSIRTCQRKISHMKQIFLDNAVSRNALMRSERDLTFTLVRLRPL